MVLLSNLVSVLRVSVVRRLDAGANWSGSMSSTRALRRRPTVVCARSSNVHNRQVRHAYESSANTKLERYSYGLDEITR